MDIRTWVLRQFQLRNRRRKIAMVARHIDENDVSTVLLVGVGTRAASVADGLIERAIGDSATVLGRTDVLLYEDRGERFCVCDGRALPFRDGAVDMVFSNAVVEHVGDEADQRQFIAEHARVGRTWITTTPNRWFPVESHTLVFLRHWRRHHRERHTGDYSRLLSLRELASLLPPSSVVHGNRWAATFAAAGARKSTGSGAS